MCLTMSDGIFTASIVFLVVIENFGHCAKHKTHKNAQKSTAACIRMELKLSYNNGSQAS